MTQFNIGTVGVGCRYHIEKRNANGEVLETRDVCNLITDVGMDTLHSTARSSSFAYVGTGAHNTSTAVAGLTTPLVKATSATGGASTNSNSPNYVETWSETHKWNVGVFAGQTVTEVGVGYVNNDINSDMFSRAAVNPPIIVDAAEELYITYYFEMHPPLVDAVATLTNSAPSAEVYTVTVRAASVQLWDADVNFQYYLDMRASTDGLEPITSRPPTTLSGYGTATTTPYVPGSHALSWTNYFTTTGAVGTINSFKTLSTQLGIQVGISPPIVKTNQMELQLGFTLSWARV